MQTPGGWHLELGNPGVISSKWQPPEPGYPPFVWADTEHGEIPIATLESPEYRVEPKPYDGIGCPDGGVRLLGNIEDNGRLIAKAWLIPELLQACEAALALLSIPVGHTMPPKEYLHVREQLLDVFTKASPSGE